MIAVTCRNGEHFTIDPDLIERVETVPDTLVVLVDGGHFVVSESFDSVLRAVRDHRAVTTMTTGRLGRDGRTSFRHGAPSRPTAVALVPGSARE